MFCSKNFKRATLSVAALIALLGQSIEAAFTESLQYDRKLPSLTASEAYRRLLKGWRVDNLGLPLIPHPKIIEFGDPETGVGFILERDPPPGGLREGIVDGKCDGETCEMVYKVLNPGWTTFPLEAHRGTVTFHNDTEGCSMQWKVEWTPLSLTWVPFWDDFVRLLITATISSAVTYVCRGDPKYGAQPDL